VTFITYEMFDFDLVVDDDNFTFVNVNVVVAKFTNRYFDVLFQVN